MHVFGGALQWFSSVAHVFVLARQYISLKGALMKGSESPSTIQAIDNGEYACQICDLVFDCG